MSSALADACAANGAVGTVGVVGTVSAAPPGRIVRLSYNESPFGPSARAREALLRLGDGAWKYAYEEVPALRDQIAKHEGVRPENVFVSEGSGEILKLAALIYGEPGRQVIATRPTFIMLPQYASRHGATVEWVDVNARYGHDFSALKAAVTDSTSLIYVCNPNNPTGTLAEPDELRAFIKQVPSRAVVLVDEAYIDFAPEPRKASMIDLVKSGANVLVTRTFSKVYGLAGLRVGYALAKPDIIRRLESVRISIPNQAGVAAASASLGDGAFYDEIRGRIAQSRDYCYRLFGELRVRYAPTHANFVMFDTGRESTEFVEFANERGVLVAAVYEPLSTWVRVTLGRMEDMRVFGETLRAFNDHA